MSAPLLPGYEDAIVLSAYADGVLDPATAEKVEKVLAERPDLQPQLAALRALQACLRQALPAAPASLDDARLETLIAQAGRPPSPPIPWWKPTRSWVRPAVLIRLAAVLVVMVVAAAIMKPEYVGYHRSVALEMSEPAVTRTALIPQPPPAPAAASVAILEGVSVPQGGAPTGGFRGLPGRVDMETKAPAPILDLKISEANKGQDSSRWFGEIKADSDKTIRAPDAASAPGVQREGGADGVWALDPTAKFANGAIMTPVPAQRPAAPVSPARPQDPSRRTRIGSTAPAAAKTKQAPRDAVEPPASGPVPNSTPVYFSRIAEAELPTPITALNLPIDTAAAGDALVVLGRKEAVSHLEVGGVANYREIGATEHPVATEAARRIAEQDRKKAEKAKESITDSRQIPADAFMDAAHGNVDHFRHNPEKPIADRDFAQILAPNRDGDQRQGHGDHGQERKKIGQRAGDLSDIAQVSRSQAFEMNLKLAEVEDERHREVGRKSEAATIPPSTSRPAITVVNNQPAHADHASRYSYIRDCAVGGGNSSVRQNIDGRVDWESYQDRETENLSRDTRGKIALVKSPSPLSPKDLSAILAAPSRAVQGAQVAGEDARLPLIVEPESAATWAAAATHIDTAGTAEVARGRALVAAARSVGLQVRLDHGRVVVGTPRTLDPTDAGGLDRAEFTAAFATAPFITTSDDARHTVAIAADTASFDRARTVLASGGKVDPSAVQVEHFVNAVPFAWPQTPAPCGDAVASVREAFTVAAEAGPAPFAAGTAATRTRLVAIGVRGNPAGADERQPLRLTLAIDASGSMAQPGGYDRVRRGLEELIGSLTAADRLAIVAFADEARVVLPATAGNDHDRIRAALDGIRPGGSTNCGDGLALAYQIAGESAVPGVAARVVLATDGATLIGATESTSRHVAAWRDRGVSLLVVGCGAQRYEAAALDRLADQGGGQHVYLGSDDEAVTAFRTRLLPARLGVLGRDAKLQVSWNPNRISHARLIGFDQRRLKHSDFRKDDVHAGSLEQDAQVTALFEVVLAADDGAGPLGEARVRYHDTRLGSVRELACPLPGSLLSATPSPRLRAAACAAELGEILAANWWANVRNASPARLAEELQRLARDSAGNPELQAFVGKLMAMTRSQMAKPASGKK